MPSPARFVPQFFLESVARAVNTYRRQHEKLLEQHSTSEARYPHEYIARLTYYDKTGKRKGVSKSAATHWDAKRQLQDLIDQHVAGGAEVLEARNMTFAALAEHCKETRYCEAFYDEQGRRLYGVREPKKFTSMINRLVSSLGHLKAERHRGQSFTTIPPLDP